MIYFVTPDIDRPSGGVRTIYRHVDALVDAGIEATVLHARTNFRCTWFEHHTPVVYPPVTVGPDDVLVFPEHHSMQMISRAAPGLRKVILNQGAYRTFATSQVVEGRVLTPYTSCPDVVATLVVSEDSERYLQFAFPAMPVFRITHWINDALFYIPGVAKARQIAVMPMKRPVEYTQLLRLLTLRGSLKGWSLVMLKDRSEPATAAILRESALFLSFAKSEGFGLPAAEALASGCAVIGFDGLGGREYLTPPFARVIDDGDMVAFAETVEDFLASYAENEGHYQRLGKEASSMIHERYSYKQQMADISGAFEEILSYPSTATGSCRLEAGDLRDESRWKTLARTAAVRAGRRVLQI